MSLVPDAFSQAWLDAELGRLGISHTACTSIDQILDALISDPPDVVFADLSRHALGIFTLRERGWFGPLYAIGDASRNLCYALGINGVLASPLSRTAFRDALSTYANDRLPAVRDDEGTAADELQRTYAADGDHPVRH
jgi:hypothetical protein